MNMNMSGNMGEATPFDDLDFLGGSPDEPAHFQPMQPMQVQMDVPMASQKKGEVEVDLLDFLN